MKVMQKNSSLEWLAAVESSVAKLRALSAQGASEACAREARELIASAQILENELLYEADVKGKI